MNDNTQHKYRYVTFAGIAARLVTYASAIATIAAMNKAWLVPASKTAITVMGVSTQPCTAKTIPSHSSLFFAGLYITE